VVREQLGLGPAVFGLMLAVVGSGAVADGVVLPPIRARLSRGSLVFWASLLACTAMALLGLAAHWALAAVTMLLFGAAWLAAGSTLQVAAQLAAPGWVRARALGVSSSRSSAPWRSAPWCGAGSARLLGYLSRSFCAPVSAQSPLLRCGGGRSTASP
jgi:Transmembrane secretion effector